MSGDATMREVECKRCLATFLLKWHGVTLPTHCPDCAAFLAERAEADNARLTEELSETKEQLVSTQTKRQKAEKSNQTMERFFAREKARSLRFQKRVEALEAERTSVLQQKGGDLLLGFQTELAGQRQRVQELEQSAGEILALIHGDGGHYQEEHGTVKALIDGKDRYLERVRQEDQENTHLCERVRELEADLLSGRLLYEEQTKEVERLRSSVKISEATIDKLIRLEARVRELVAWKSQAGGLLERIEGRIAHACGLVTCGTKEQACDKLADTLTEIRAFLHPKPEQEKNMKDRVELMNAIEHALEKGKIPNACGQEHQQLGLWLQELVSLRRQRDALKEALERIANRDDYNAAYDTGVADEMQSIAQAALDEAAKEERDSTVCYLRSLTDTTIADTIRMTEEE